VRGIARLRGGGNAHKGIMGVKTIAFRVGMAFMQLNQSHRAWVYYHKEVKQRKGNEMKWFWEAMQIEDIRIAMVGLAKVRYDRLPLTR
jgi:hypothetical protein